MSTNRHLLFLAMPLAIAALSTKAEPFDKAARWEAWQKFAASYEPDLSDSSKCLEPPTTGRIAKPIRIAEGGKALAEIVVDLSDAICIDNFFTDKSKWCLELRYARGNEIPAARTAAFTLRAGLKLITGAEFPIKCESCPDARAQSRAERGSGAAEAPVRIYLGASFAKDLFPEDIAALTAGRAFDGFAVRVKDGDIYIFGAAPAGTIYGVDAFLENNTDLIWAYPDPTGTVYTKTPDLDIVWADAREIPVFVVRGWQGGEQTWQMRNRSNYLAHNPSHGFFGVHGGHFLCPQYYDHCVGLRKFNSMNAKGIRPLSWDESRHHACLSDPEFLPHVLETVPNVEELDYNAPYHEIIGMDDNSAVCHCPKCKAPIPAEDGTMLTPEKDGELFWSAWFYTYLNKVDDDVQKYHPGYMTSTFAYFFAKQKPPIKVNKTIVPVLCNYPRSILTEPIYSPRNAIWQKVYEGWAAHSPEILLYDYYGFLAGQPYAEIFKEELAYQRSIGFLATSTEGFMDNDPLGAADERWCMTRLAWNPDLPTEELHRYFNRRAYREAAPAMDKLRGAVRKAYYAANQKDLRKVIAAAKLEDELIGYVDEAVAAVRHPGAKRLVDRVAASWYAFLGRTSKSSGSAAAEGIWHLKANKWNIKTAYNGERCIRIGLKNGEVGIPPGAGKGTLCRMRVHPTEGAFETRGYPAVSYKWKPQTPGERCESRSRPLGNGDFEITARMPSEVPAVALGFAIGAPRKGLWTPPECGMDILEFEFMKDDGMPLAADEPPAPLDKQRLAAIRAAYEKAEQSPYDELKKRGEEAYLSDRLIPEERRREALIEAVQDHIGLDNWDADTALAYFRKYLDDGQARACGVSRLMNISKGSGAISKFADVCASRGRFAEAAKIYDAWENWDGDRTPLSIRWKRRNAKMSFLAKHKSRAEAKALYDAALPDWKSFLRRCSKEIRKADLRGRCELALLALEKDEIPAAEYAKRMDALLMDEYMPNTLRRDVAVRLPETHAVNGKTDWAEVERILIAALESGDWSNLTRSCYTRQSSSDLQLNALVAVVGKMADGGETARAKALLEKGAKILGYDREPAQVLAEENKTIPATFERATLSQIKERFALLQKCRSRFDKAKFEIEEEKLGIDLDEI